MFGMFRRKKKLAETVGSPGTTKDDAILKSRDDPPKFFGRPREEEEIKLTDVLGKLLQRLKNLENARTELVEQIYQLGGEAEKEAEDLEKELSTLKEQVTELEKVLSAIHAHRKGVRSQELRY